MGLIGPQAMLTEVRTLRNILYQNGVARLAGVKAAGGKFVHYTTLRRCGHHGNHHRSAVDEHLLAGEASGTNTDDLHFRAIALISYRTESSTPDVIKSEAEPMLHADKG
ncbi:MAG: hypothetical protein K2Y71_30185 [Xanthobacteraceae bacterium]|nr:hypothetical protein [Xanthobacteraceae bacterium]